MMETKYIDKIGIEFEGAWKNTNISNILYGTYGKFEDDSSINKNNLSFDYLKGELSTLPYTYDKIFDVIDICAPDEVDEITGSCGLHFHLSFKSPAHYWILADLDFHDAFCKSAVEWAKEKFPTKRCPDSFGDFFIEDYRYTRIATGKKPNGDQHCKPVFDIDCRRKLQTLNGNWNDRYRHINYRAYIDHKTIEFRLHSGYSDKDLIKSALQHLVNFIEDYLECLYKENKADIPKYKSSINIEDIELDVPYIENLGKSDIEKASGMLGEIIKCAY